MLSVLGLASFRCSCLPTEMSKQYFSCLQLLKFTSNEVLMVCDSGMKRTKLKLRVLRRERKKENNQNAISRASAMQRWAVWGSQERTSNTTILQRVMTGSTRRKMRLVAQSSNWDVRVSTQKENWTYTKDCWGSAAFICALPHRLENREEVNHLYHLWLIRC